MKPMLAHPSWDHLKNLQRGTTAHVSTVCLLAEKAPHPFSFSAAVFDRRPGMRLGGRIPSIGADKA